MIRFAFINNQVLNLYNNLSEIKFHLDMKDVIKHVPNCRYMSYQDFAKINNCSIDDVIQVCESKSGCTHYDIIHGRYLILCNQSTDDNNNFGRQLWTCGHEVGHVVCNHLQISTYEKLSENNLVNITDKAYETEADIFSATLISPFPIFKTVGITCSEDIHDFFGLSWEASINRYNQYLKWKSSRIKTAWENDIIHLYNLKK